MTNSHCRRFWLALLVCYLPAFSQSAVTYQISFAGVGSGSVAAPAFNLQYISAGFLQPSGNNFVRMFGQPGFSINVSPPAGYSLSDAVFFGGSGSPYFSVAFANASTSILINLYPTPATALLSNGAYVLVSTTTLIGPGGQPVTGN